MIKDTVSGAGLNPSSTSYYLYNLGQVTYSLCVFFLFI